MLAILHFEQGQLICVPHGISRVALLSLDNPLLRSLLSHFGKVSAGCQLGTQLRLLSKVFGCSLHGLSNWDSSQHREGGLGVIRLLTCWLVGPGVQKHNMPGLLKALSLNWHTLNFSAFCWLKQVTSQLRFNGRGRHRCMNTRALKNILPQQIIPYTISKSTNQYVSSQYQFHFNLI